MTFDQWLLTESGKNCADYPITGGGEYLRNRLWWAFEAGRAAERGDIRPNGQHPNPPASASEPK